MKNDELNDETKCIAKIVTIVELAPDKDNPDADVINATHSTDADTEKNWQNVPDNYELSIIHWRALKKFDTMFLPKELKSKSALGWCELNGIKKSYVFRIGINPKTNARYFLYINVIMEDYMLTQKDHYRIVTILKDLQKTYTVSSWWSKKKLITN